MNLSKLPGEVPKSKFAIRIIKKHPFGHFTGLVYGNKRCGKSIYAIRVAWEVYEALGYSQDDAFDKALEQFVFTPQDFISRIRTARKDAKKNERNKTPLIILDDASMALSGQSYQNPETRDSYYEMRDIWAMMGTAVSCVILTTPDPGDVSDRFSWDLRVHITQRSDDWRRIANGYTERLIGKRKTKKISKTGGFYEMFSSYLQNRYYHKLRDKRMEYLEMVDAKHQLIRDRRQWKQDAIKEREITEAFGSPQPLNTNPNTTNIGENAPTSEM